MMKNPENPENLENFAETVKKFRYSISVSNRTYDRLRAAVPSGSLAGFVDGIITDMFSDPVILMKTAARCRKAPR